MKKTIWFDMDGTLADLYGVDNWLEKLRAEDATPYTEAYVMHNMSLLARTLNKLQKLGYHIGIITWFAKDATAEYDKMVKQAKEKWLHQHLRSVTFNEIYMVPYGCPKTIFMNTEHDILFDDNKNIREEWTGEAHDPYEMFSILDELLRME